MDTSSDFYRNQMCKCGHLGHYHSGACSVCLVEKAMGYQCQEFDALEGEDMAGVWNATEDDFCLCGRSKAAHRSTGVGFTAESCYRTLVNRLSWGCSGFRRQE